MTQQNPDQIRADIERTRHELSSDVDALAEKVTPSQVARRQTDRVKETVGGWKDRVMGSADEATTQLSDRAHGAGEAVRSNVQDAADAAKGAPEEVSRRTRGNPLAAGLIAVGAGWLLASLLPATQQEKRAATRLQDSAQPLMDEARSQARSMAEELEQPARDAAERVQESARESVDHVRSEAALQKDEVAQSAEDSARHLRGI